MNELTFTDFAGLIAKQGGLNISNISPDSLLSADLGFAGDDVRELIELLSTTYGTDFSEFPVEGVAGLEAAFNPFIYLWKILKKEKDQDVLLSELFSAVKRGRWGENC